MEAKTLLSLLPGDLALDKWRKMEGWMDGWKIVIIKVNVPAPQIRQGCTEWHFCTFKASIEVFDCSHLSNSTKCMILSISVAQSLSATVLKIPGFSDVAVVTFTFTDYTLYFTDQRCII